MKNTLTQAVMNYRKTGEGWSLLFERISLFAYKYPRKWTDWDEDKCSDFFLSFMPRIPGLIERFQPDYSFETYLMSSLRWFTKTFTEKQASREHYEGWAVEISEAMAQQNTPESYPVNAEPDPLESCPFKLDKTGKLEDPTLRRRVLYAFLLRAADMDDHCIPAVAALMDVDPDWLYDQTRRARSLVSWKIDRREKLRQRRNECWYHLDAARKRVETAFDSERQNQWKDRAQTWKNRHARACSGIRRMNIAPSHQDIGRILNVPTGTISSGLHFLRKYWNEIEN